MIFRLFLVIASILATLFIVFGGFVLLQPEWIFSKLRRRSPEVLYAVDTQQPVVALTIDDGPDPDTTPKILAVLDEYQAHATFFIITERVPGNESILQQMVAGGHELGNHLTVDEPSINLPLDEFERKLIQADEVLSEFGDMIWLRPGSGWYNDEMLEIMARYGYRCALGSVYPYDPQVGSAWFASNYVLWKIKPGDVIVLHDHQSRGRRTAKALETILPELARRGYKVVTLFELDSLAKVKE